ncbi:cupredoxin domain-containing protein [Leifsonia sp. YAF41]|uniref:cupredoxin domain-containing protein n=1 Tax=Leifsonia sp. YAF41 TaxID=3233086 RepID=UPI003F988393
MKSSGLVRYAATVAIVLLLAGCSSGGGMTNSAPTSSPAPSGNSSVTTWAITVKDFGFQGPPSVPPGATVTVTNLDNVAHTVTADDGTSFDVTIKGSGDTASFKAPTKPGSYAYHCTFHPDMHGTLVVTGGS